VLHLDIGGWRLQVIDVAEAGLGDANIAKGTKGHHVGHRAHHLITYLEVSDGRHLLL
jgi:hypothetical protein